MMKNIGYICALLLSLCIISCSRENIAPLNLKVLSSNVIFTADGGVGSIQVASSGKISATSDRDWCTVVSDENIVTVTVTRNSGMEGRTAAVTITSNGAMAGIFLGVNGVYSIYSAVLTKNGLLNWNPICSYNAYPSSADGKFALVFGDSGTMEGDNINGIAYWAFKGTPSPANSVGYMGLFHHLVLTK